MVAPAVEIHGERLSVHFSDFGPESYHRFLEVKRLPEFEITYLPDETYRVTAPARFASMLGVTEIPVVHDDLPISKFLFDDQAAIVRMFLKTKRFACWSGCGNGKTLIALECARHVVHRTGGRVLIFTLNDLVPQWIEEARTFYGKKLKIIRLESREHMKEWAAGKRPDEPMIAITNYEKMNFKGKASPEQVVNELRYLAGVFVDENRLKGGGGKQKWAIIHSCKGIEYKLSLTATPAPNDTIEFASQASFLEKMRAEGEIIWTYFQRDEKTHRWSVKPHARKAFFEFMSSWSIYVRDPRRYGWRKDFPDIPKPTMIRHDIEMTSDQRKSLQKLTRTASGQMSLIDKNDRNAIERNKLSQVAKGFIYVKRGPDGKLKASKAETNKIVRIPSLKPEFVARLMIQEMEAGYKPLCWTVFDAESDLIEEELRRLGCKQFDTLHGKHKMAERVATLERYRHGESTGLLTKGSLLGWGMNFQFCKSMIFSGFDDSYEKWFQQIARAVRYGQTDGVRIHLPVIEELEGDMLENLLIKQDRHEAAINEMENNYIAASRVTGVLAA
jgi:hypothetical protein